jgi:hypothetical protein
MATTNAQRQRTWRQRQARHIAALQAERDRLQADLDAAHAEVKRLAAMACRHPSAAVVGGTCRACGTEIW